MKNCRNCGTANEDGARYCMRCGCPEFAGAPASRDNAVPAGAPTSQMPGPAYAVPQRPKKQLTVYDMFGLLGFVASLAGMLVASVILHPVAAVSSVVAFRKDTRFKGLAIAGFVVSVVGGVVFAVISLYRAGLIPEWITEGAFR